VELLAVLAIVGVLAAIVVTAVFRMRTNARETKCISNLRQLGVAAILFSTEHRDYMPDINWWAVELLPYVGGGDAYDDVFWCPSATTEENPLNASHNLSRYPNGDLIPIAYGINANYPSNDGAILQNNFGTRNRRRSAMENPSKVMMFAEQVGGYANLFYNGPDRFSLRHSHQNESSGRMQLNMVHIDGSAGRIDIAYDATTGSEWRRFMDPR
jgi:type II secretory pathway pseudopilin PulG